MPPIDPSEMSLGQRWVVGLRYATGQALTGLDGHPVGSEERAVRITLTSGESFTIAGAGWEPAHLGPLGWVTFAVYPDDEAQMIQAGPQEWDVVTPKSMTVPISAIYKVEFLRVPEPRKRAAGFSIPDDPEQPSPH
jgi:hypothetical protein